ncbi:MAG: J domain-containing protein [Rhodospirillaceae bacterium]|nr:J domain-containing protein [Rhodospirillaceae bacterium]
MSSTGSESSTKQSYTIPCASRFRDAVLALAAKRGVNVADLARSVALMVPAETLTAFPDPGEPEAQDREIIVIKSGPSAGRPWQRKPRLQVRMAPGFDAEILRRALGVALAMDKGEAAVLLDAPSHGVSAATHDPEEVDRLKAMVSALAFDPLDEGVQTRDEALHVLGFPPGASPDTREVRARFRILATIHHPDGDYGSHHRMSQLNSAMDVLRGEVALY